MITAKIICDSLSPNGIRLTTMELMFPRFILCEFNTHRMFSRNTSSSRAIPIQRMIDSILECPAYPESWGVNQKGMQAKDTLGENDMRESRSIWEEAMFAAIDQAKKLVELNVHKQIVNRLLEPFAHVKVIITATEWENFFELRCHKDAQPEFRILAELMKNELLSHSPKKLDYGKWHTPYINYMINDDLLIQKYFEKQWVEQTNECKDSMPLCPQDKEWVDLKCVMSVSRCARVSYLTHDKKIPSIEVDLNLFNKLVGSKPLHASPLEHIATPGISNGFYKNFYGWIQYRQDYEETIDVE
jgi:thymidylate synthase ThyX